MELSNLYQMMPGKDCGICGYGSCSTFARHVVFGKEDLTKCAWLAEGEHEPIEQNLSEITPLPTRVQHLAGFSPCVTDSNLVMAEFYLAPRETDYGYIDPVFCQYLPLYFESIKCSETLGIARIEFEEREILLSQTGKVVVRQAQSESDALEICDLISRLVSEAVICSCLATGIECVSGLCTVSECNILQNVASAKKTHKTETLEPAVLSIVDQIWSGNQVSSHHVISLKRRALSALADTVRGLVGLSLIHHVGCMCKALKDAASYTEKEKQHQFYEIVRELLSSRIPDNYEKVSAYLQQQFTPSSMELHKALFHATLITQIKEQFL